MKQNKWNSEGYSLVEIIFAVLILAVILAYALYSYQNFTDKAKIEEAARLAYEIRQGVDAHVASKRVFPAPITRTYGDLQYVERAETQQDGPDRYRINVYFNRDAFPGSSSQKVFTLYGNLIDNHMDWNECEDSCVKNAVDIPPAQPVPPAPNHGIVTTPGQPPIPPTIDILKPYGNTKVVIKFKGGNEFDGAIRANVRATKKGQPTNNIGDKKYYGLEKYVLPGGEHPFDVITAELEQFDKDKGTWVKVWSRNVDSAPRGRDLEFEFFETIPTKYQPTPETPTWVEKPTFPGDNWNGNGDPNPGGGDFLPEPPKQLYDWKTTNVSVLNEAGYVGKVIFTIHYRNGKKKTYTKEQAIGSEYAVRVPGWRAHENPVKKIDVRTEWIGPNCGFLSLEWCWKGISTRTVRPAGSDRDKYACFKYWGTIFSRVMGTENNNCSGRFFVD